MADPHFVFSYRGAGRLRHCDHRFYRHLVGTGLGNRENLAGAGDECGAGGASRGGVDRWAVGGSHRSQEGVGAVAGAVRRFQPVDGVRHHLANADIAALLNRAWAGCGNAERSHPDVGICAGTQACAAGQPDVLRLSARVIDGRFRFRLADPALRLAKRDGAGRRDAAAVGGGADRRAAGVRPFYGGAWLSGTAYCRGA
ncbi:hypothetical protein D3C78_886840 [compost metagenome]